MLYINTCRYCVVITVFFCLSVCVHLTSFKVQTSYQLGQFINCPSQMLTKFIVVSTLGGLALCRLHKFVSFCMHALCRQNVLSWNMWPHYIIKWKCIFFVTLSHLWVLSNQCKHAKCISMICNGASFKIENFMAFGLTHKSYSIVRKLLHDTQVNYKAHGPLVFKMVNSFNYGK